MKSLTLRILNGLWLAAIVMATPNSFASSSPVYTLTKSIPLGAPDRWDYLTYDAHAHRVYVAHGDHLTVVDANSGSIIGQVTGMPGGTHGIGIASALNRGLTDDGHAGTVAVFDSNSLELIKTLPAAPDADGIAPDQFSGHFFVIDGDSGIVTVVDPKSETVVANITVGGKLEFGVADNHGKLYVNGAENKEIIRIDTATNRVDARWPVPNCTSPHGMAIDTASHRLFSSCVNNVLVVVDTRTGATVASVPIGSGTDAAAFDSRRKLIFSSNGRDGTLTVIKEKNANTYTVVATIKTAVTARTMALDPDTGRIFLVAADIDHNASSPNGRPVVMPGSLKLLVMSPAQF